MVDHLLASIAHLVFAGLWVGSVCYVAFAIVPLARDGAFRSTEPLDAAAGRLATISRVSALALLLSGGHLAGTSYTAAGLVETVRGRLVLLMVALWFVMIVLVEVGLRRFRTGLETKKLREPARDALPVLRAAAVTGLSLLVVAGLLSGNVAQVL